jgi:hypothetical protein
MPLTFTPTDDTPIAFVIDFDRFDCEDFARGFGRWQYKCSIVLDGQTFDAGIVRSSTTSQFLPEGLASMLGSFLIFFSAFVAAELGGEDYDLFPVECRPIAEILNPDELTLWANDLRRTV